MIASTETPGDNHPGWLALPPGIDKDALTLIDRLRSGRTTARDALENCLAAIETLNGDINAIVLLDATGARAAADRRDEDRRMGRKQPPLHGVPVTIKDSFDWVGKPTTWGDPARSGHIAEQDSAIVARLREAGAVLIGKTNIPPYLSDWETDNPIFGATRNPYDLARSAGGSSGGSAAAVASGMSYADIGSDQGGSVRLPAHYCGVHGLKPTWSRISLRGHSHSGERRMPDIGVAGPIARSARDVSLLISLLSDAPDLAPTALGLNYAAAPLKGLRIAVLSSHAGCPIDHAYAAVLSQFVEQIENVGAVVIRDLAPDFDFERATEVMNLLVRAETSSKAEAISRFRASQKLQETQSLGSEDREAMNRRGTELSHREWLELHEERLVYCEILNAFFARFDLILCPAGASAAPPLRPGQSVAGRTIPVNDKEEPVLNQHLWFMFGSLCYLPAHVAPIGLTETGLPVGVQIIGPHGHDTSVLNFARSLDRYNIGMAK